MGSSVQSRFCPFQSVQLKLQRGRLRAVQDSRKGPHCGTVIKGPATGIKGPRIGGGVRGLFIVSCTGALKVLVMPLSNYVS